ncbi:OmpH family outer membrane protein [uncultured Desulfovibrio sp.]|uniref:OmpH family outer membrane protein n=1 Tax=uncultured Desulfovibrio sp. TaxID=167968 RepID=UPI002622E135|nr:OmpH family outer membrane protein [uncultured Desulfovibrio sp.]
MSYVRHLLLLLAAVLLWGGTPWAAPLLKSVDVNVILQKSRPARDAAAHLEKVRATLQQGYDTLAASQKDKKDIAEEARKMDLARAQALLQNQMNLETAAVRKIVLEALAKTCEAWGKEHPTLWLVPRGSVLAAPAADDVTPDILKRMESQQVTFPALPTVTIKDGSIEDGSLRKETPPAAITPDGEFRAPIKDTPYPGAAATPQKP